VASHSATWPPKIWRTSTPGNQVALHTAAEQCHITLGRVAGERALSRRYCPDRQFCFQTMTLNRHDLEADIAKLYSVTSQAKVETSAESQLDNFSPGTASHDASVALTQAYAKTMRRQVIMAQSRMKVDRVGEQLDALRSRGDDIVTALASRT
jgi:hypothetical protein